MFEIETTRCRVRAWKGDQHERDALTRWTSNPEMMRYITGETWNDEARDKFFERQQLLMATAGVCFGVAELKQTGEIVGIAGLAPLERVDDWQIGWWVDPVWQGKGLGSEFGRALVDYTLNIAGRLCAVAVIAPENIASRRVAEKAGMQYAKTVRANTLESRWKDEDVMLYESRKES